VQYTGLFHLHNPFATILLKKIPAHLGRALPLVVALALQHKGFCLFVIAAGSHRRRFICCLNAGQKIFHYVERD
jgi:hypothetical protein